MLSLESRVAERVQFWRALSDVHAYPVVSILSHDAPLYFKWFRWIQRMKRINT
ncbi:unnamed protein product, partial [Allacma fusca]